MTPDYRTLSGADFQREVGDDVDKWTDAAMISAEDAGYKIDRDWLRSLLDDAMEAARKGSIRGVPTTRRLLILAALLLPSVAHAQAPALTYEDRSGTITAGGTAQVVLPAWTGRHGCVVQNQSAGSLWVSETATAVAGPPSILIPAGQQFLCMSPASGQAYSIIGGTTAQAFAARQW